MLSNCRVYFTLSATLLKTAIKRVFSFRQTFSCRLLQRMASMGMKLDTDGIFQVLNLCMEK